MLVHEVSSGQELFKVVHTYITSKTAIGCGAS